MYHRVRQFFRALFARVRARERTLVASYLSRPQAILFGRMARCDQRHCLDVFYTLYNAGHRDPALLQAALMHDIGKAAGRAAGKLRLWHRVAVVLMQRFAPRQLARLAADGHGWKEPFAVHVRHAQTSAQWAARAGCSPDIVHLIRKHHDPHIQDERSAALQWADRQN